jgi:hypothetical protein
VTGGPGGAGERGAGAAGAGEPGAGQRSPGQPGARDTRPRVWLPPRRAALLVGGAGLALVGLVVLLAVWIGLVTATLRTGLAEGGDACVSAVTDGTGDAAVSTSLLPPRAVCTRTVDGRVAETVLASSPLALAGAAAAAAGAGVAVVAVTGVAALRARRRD